MKRLLNLIQTTATVAFLLAMLVLICYFKTGKFLELAGLSLLYAAIYIFGGVFVFNWQFYSGIFDFFGNRRYNEHKD